jgi:hypothetical protein
VIDATEAANGGAVVAGRFALTKTTALSLIPQIRQIADDLELLASEMAKTELDGAVVVDCLREARHTVPEVSSEIGQRTGSQGV